MLYSFDLVLDYLGKKQKIAPSFSYWFVLPKDIVGSMKNKKGKWLFKEVHLTIAREAEFYYF